MEYKHFEGAGSVRADVVVSDNGCRFVCYRMCVKVIVNLFSLVEVCCAFLVVPTVVIEYAQVKVIEEFRLFAVKIFVLFLDFVNCRFVPFVLKNGG